MVKILKVKKIFWKIKILKKNLLKKIVKEIVKTFVKKKVVKKFVKRNCFSTTSMLSFESEFATIHPRFPLAAEGVFVKEIPTRAPKKQHNICKDNRYMLTKTTLMPNTYISLKTNFPKKYFCKFNSHVISPILNSKISQTLKPLK